MPTTTDICIIGGGPAGSVLGAKLAQFGWKVCVVEKAIFPRRRLGESLSPGVLPLLASIGAGPAIERGGFPRVRKVTVRWDRKHDREDPSGQGMLVDRGHFDRLLLDHARDCGVRIFQPATVQELARHPDGWTMVISSRGRTTELAARFVADAAGRSGLLPRDHRTTGARTLALHAYWTGTGFPEHPRIEAGADQWFWGVPLPDGVYNTLVFVDPRDLRAMPGTLTEKFHALIDRSSLIPPRMNATVVGRVQATDATPYLDETSVTNETIKVGEAALGLDPLSSSGVQKAIQTSLAGSVVVNTLLERPEAAAMARQFYRDRIREASERHREWAVGHYGQAAAHRDSRFWRERSVGAPAVEMKLPDADLEVSPDTPLQVSPGVEYVEVPCVVDRFVEARPAVRAPSLRDPVAFVGESEVAPLLRSVRSGMTPREIVQSWARVVLPPQGVAIAQWLVSRGMLVPLTGVERGDA